MIKTTTNTCNHRNPETNNCPAVDCDTLLSEVTRLAWDLTNKDWEDPVKLAALIQHVQRLRQDLAGHIDSVESPHGLIDDTDTRCPRLHAKLQRLCSEHLDIARRLEVIELDLKLFDGGKAMARGLRTAAMDLLRAFNDHQNEATEVIMDAFNTDIGAGD